MSITLEVRLGTDVVGTRACDNIAEAASVLAIEGRALLKVLLSAAENTAAVVRASGLGVVNAATAAALVNWPRIILVAPPSTVLSVLCIASVDDTEPDERDSMTVDVSSTVPTCPVDAAVEAASPVDNISPVASPITEDVAESSDVTGSVPVVEILGIAEVPSAVVPMLGIALEMPPGDVAANVTGAVPVDEMDEKLVSHGVPADVAEEEAGLEMTEDADLEVSRSIVLVIAAEIGSASALLEVKARLLLLVVIKDVGIAVGDTVIVLAMTLEPVVLGDPEVSTVLKAGVALLLNDMDADVDTVADVEGAVLDGVNVEDGIDDDGVAAGDVVAEVIEAVDTGVEAEVTNAEVEADGVVSKAVVGTEAAELEVDIEAEIIEVEGL